MGLAQSFRAQTKWRPILCQNTTGMTSSPFPNGVFISFTNIQFMDTAIAGMYRLLWVDADFSLTSADSFWVNGRSIKTSASMSSLSVGELSHLKAWLWLLLSSAHREVNHLRRVCAKLALLPAHSWWQQDNSIEGLIFQKMFIFTCFVIHREHIHHRECVHVYITS